MAPSTERGQYIWEGELQLRQQIQSEQLWQQKQSS